MKIRSDWSDWRKSSYSGTRNCVEVRGGSDDVVELRDSKVTSGPVIGFSAEGWTAFIQNLQVSDAI